jgi:hypothetical protein
VKIKHVSLLNKATASRKKGICGGVGDVK